MTTLMTDIVNPIFFWGHRTNNILPEEKCLSNFFPAEFFDHESKIQFYTSEQYMMYHKDKLFGDSEMMRNILSTKDPAKCKGFGRLVKGFNPEVWNGECKDIVAKGCYLKFSQNPILGAYLKSTGLDC